MSKGCGKSGRRPDRRLERTRKLLHDSLIALILEKGYDAVTIQNITDHANLTRATFYLHYDNKDELLICALEEVFDELVERMEPLAAFDLTMSGTPSSLIAFQHAGENRDLYRVMLRSQNVGTILQRIKDYLVKHLREKCDPLLPPEAALPASREVIYQHMASSLLGLITWWLENDPPYSAEQMAQMYHQLNVAPFLQTAASPDTPG
jgi:AcrR family transcriptional regulator